MAAMRAAVDSKDFATMRQLYEADQFIVLGDGDPVEVLEVQGDLVHVKVVGGYPLEPKCVGCPLRDVSLAVMLAPL